MLLEAASLNGPVIFARIAMMQAIARGDRDPVPVVKPTTKTRWFKKPVSAWR
jgi:hypothetical protein